MAQETANPDTAMPKWSLFLPNPSAQPLAERREPWDELTNYVDGEGRPLVELGPLADINIFVGANNAGKSRLLRAILKGKKPNAGYNFMRHGTASARNFVIGLIDGLLDELKKFLYIEVHKRWSSDRDSHSEPEHWREAHFLALKQYTIQGTRDQQGPYARGISSNINLSQLIERLKTSGAYWNEADKKATNHMPSYEVRVQAHAFDTPLKADETCKKFKGLAIEIYRLEGLYGNGKNDQAQPLAQPPALIYTPVLRTAVSLRKGEERFEHDLFHDTVRHNLGVKHAEIFTGLSLYERIFNERNSPAEIRDRFAEFEHFLSEKFFPGYRLELVAHHHDDPRHRHIFVTFRDKNGNRGQEYPLHHLGDGIVALILIMYRIFMAKEGSWIFIEEPEISLHPGLQRIFLMALLEDAKLSERKIRVFFTTHSNHLLDLTLRWPDRVSVFCFEKSERDSQFAVRNVFGPDLGVLNELGVQNGSVFLANCSIWVEGPTDRVYVQAYLKAYCNELKTKGELSFNPLEDLHYAFILYGGSLLDHYTMEDNSIEFPIQSDKLKAQFVANRIFLLADQDENKQNKHDRFSKINGKHFSYRTTGVVEIENLISATLLKEVLPKLFKRLTPEIVDGISFDETEYRDRRMGAYLNEKLGAHKYSGAEEKNGTLETSYKTTLAGLVAKHVLWEKMSDGAKKLAKDVYDFIKDHNSYVEKPPVNPA